MEMELKFDLFVTGLVLVPILVNFVSALRQRLHGFAKSSTVSPISIAIAACLLFVFDDQEDWLNMVSTSIGFILFFITYAVALSSMKLAKENQS